MNKSFLVVCILSISIYVLFSCAQHEEFVMPRKKEPAVSSQQCAENLGCIINFFPRLMSECAQIQLLFSDVLGAALTHLNGYVDGDKESFLQKASKEQRAEFNKNSVMIKKELEEMARRQERDKHLLQKYLVMLKND